MSMKFADIIILLGKSRFSKLNQHEKEFALQA